MDKKYITIIAVVAIVVIAAAAAVFLLNSGNGGGNEGGGGTGPEYENLNTISLSIYGNANEDYTIDQKDIDLINQMISSGTALSEHPYADADGDGEVTSADVDVVKKFIAGEKTKIRLIDQYAYYSGVDHLAVIDYPLENVVAINPEMIQMTFYFDGDEKVAGYVANPTSNPVNFYKILNNGFSRSLGTTARNLTQVEWQALTALSSELYEKGEAIGAVLAYNDEALKEYKDDIQNAEIPIIYLRCTDPVYSIDAALLLGMLMGPKYAAKAQEFANDCRKAVADITTAVQNLPDDDRVHFIALCMWRYISQHDSQYTKIGISAGGIDEANLEGNASVPLADVEAITKFNGKIDYILNCRTSDCVVTDPVVLWGDSRLDILKKSTEYENMFFLNLSIPAPCRVMYAASMFYPDLITTDQANNYFQLMVDKYLSYLDNTVADGDFDVRTDITVISTYQDYINAGGSDEPAEVQTDIDVIGLAERFYKEFKDDFDIKAEGEPNYSEAPFALSDENTSKEASVVSSGGSYSVKYTIMDDPEEKFNQMKTAYLKKIGTDFRGGTYIELPYTNPLLTDCFGYYLNTDRNNPDPVIVFGSFKFAGYVEHCYVEINLLKRPWLEMDDLERLVSAAFTVAAGSDVDAKAWAQSVDLSILSGFTGAPFSVQDGATAEKAAIYDSESKRYITFDSTANASSAFEEHKADYTEKMTSTTHATELITGFDDSFGFIAHRPNGVTFTMVYFTCLKDGCCVDMTLRIDNFSYPIEDATALVKKILDAQPA
jgi:hypothetical protein